MKTIIYLFRHSVPYNEHRGIELLVDDLLIENKKAPLSVRGEERALSLSQLEELENIDLVYSSDYARTMGTAKYVALKNHLKVNVDYRLGERVHGVSSYDQLPDGFEKKQLEDENFKMNDGESRSEVVKRFKLAIDEILQEHIGKKIVIISHATAITFLLMSFGKYSDGQLYFNDELIMDKDFVWSAPDGFKLIFNDHALEKIEHIKVDI